MDFDPVKAAAWLEDIAEVGWGLVGTGTHFKMRELWASIGGREEARAVKKVLRELGEGDSTQWDLEDARQELRLREFSADDVETAIPARLKELASYLEYQRELSPRA